MLLLTSLLSKSLLIYMTTQWAYSWTSNAPVRTQTVTFTCSANRYISELRKMKATGRVVQWGSIASSLTMLFPAISLLLKTQNFTPSVETEENRNCFISFLESKIDAIDSLVSNSSTQRPYIPEMLLGSAKTLCCFDAVSQQEVESIFTNRKSSTCRTAPVITFIINQSLQTGFIPCT